MGTLRNKKMGVPRKADDARNGDGLEKAIENQREIEKGMKLVLVRRGISILLPMAFTDEMVKEAVEAIGRSLKKRGVIDQLIDKDI